MGFSVSGATAVILIGGLIAFSIGFSAMNDGYERISDAREDRDDRLLSQANSEVVIANASYDGTASELTVHVNNTGSAELVVDEMSLLVNGTYRDDVTTSVADDATTAVLLPGEQLAMTMNQSVAPDRVKIVAGTGVAATETEVTTSG